MRINSRTVTILGFLLFFGAAIAGAANAPTGFRDLTWGASPGKQLKKIPGSLGGDVILYQPRQGKTPPPLFKIPVVGEAYSFSKDKFFSASAWLDGKKNHEKIKAALIKKYGQPSVTDERRNFRIWTWPDSTVEVRLAYDEKFSRATVTFINTSLAVPR